MQRSLKNLSWNSHGAFFKSSSFREKLVARFSQIEGYRCLSLMRALGVVKCQLALV